MKELAFVASGGSESRAGCKNRAKIPKSAATKLFDNIWNDSKMSKTFQTEEMCFEYRMFGRHWIASCSNHCYQIE